VIAALAPETVFLPQEVGGAGAIGPDAYDDLMDHSERAGSVVLGPGLSSATGAVELATRLCRDLPGGLVLDGDGLVALAGKPEISRGRDEPPIFTPHPGEMARLAGVSTREIAARRMETARETAETYGAVVILKGAHTLIAEPGGRIWINLTGNDGMGTAGSGDVLAGTVGALRAGGMEPAEAARTGAYLHGLAGDIAAATLGPDGMTARDILNALPLALLRRRSNDDDPFAGKIIAV
jgi:NAD(P)H-hydrate epimerase